ncbi:MAG TPA: hypothetical protein VLE21_03040 [Candidatus Nitrosocosmicus sp.]|nr:hypothetical protein [Candidatus Nitrosocosmicus sp.]
MEDEVWAADNWFEEWQAQSHGIIFISKEQSSSGPHVSFTGQLPGQSECLSFLQKKVRNIFGRFRLA